MKRTQVFNIIKKHLQGLSKEKAFVIAESLSEEICEKMEFTKKERKNIKEREGVDMNKVITETNP